MDLPLGTAQDRLSSWSAALAAGMTRSERALAISGSDERRVLKAPLVEDGILTG